MDSKLEQHCFCYSCGKTCGKASEFEKILEVRDAGLIIYKTGTDTGIDVIILHNFKNVEIPSRDIQKSLGLEAKNSPGRIHTIPQTYMSHCKCEETVEKFLRSAAKENVDNVTPKIKMWLDKSNRFLQSSYANEKKGNQLITRTRSESYFKENSEDLTGHWSDYNKFHDKKQVSVKSFLRSKTEEGKINFSQNFYSGQDPMEQGPQRQKTIASKSLSPSQASDENFFKTLAHIKENKDKKTFQIIFPKDKDKKANITESISSSTLIKDIEVQGKIRDSEEKTQLEGRNKKASMTSITDKSSHGMEDKEVRGKIRDSEEKTQLGGLAKKANVTSNTDKPSNVMIDKEVQVKTRHSDKKTQAEAQDEKTNVTSITDKPSHGMKDKEVQGKIRSSEKKIQLERQDKKTKMTSITDKPSHEMKDKEGQDKIRDSEKKAQLEGQDKKKRKASIIDKPSHEMNDKQVQGKIRDSEKKAQLERQGKKTTKVTSITDKPLHGMKDNDEKKRPLEGNNTKAKATNITDAPSGDTTDRKKRQTKKEQHNEKLEQKELKADNKMGIQKKFKIKGDFKMTEREKDQSNLEEPYANELKSKINGKTKENDKKTKPQDLKKSQSLEDQTQEKPTVESIKSNKTLKSAKSTSKNPNYVKDDTMLNFLLKLQKEDAELLRKEKREAIALEKSRLLAEKKLQRILNQPVHKSNVYQCHHTHHAPVFEETSGESILDSENQINNPDIVVGQNIVNDKQLITKSISDMPQHTTETINQSISKTLHPPSVSAAKLENVPAQKQAILDNEDKGVIKYALSNRKFIDMGWTQLPTEKVVRKMNVYRMHPSHPEFDWFAHNKEKGEMLYSSGERLAEFTDDGRGRWFYRSGRLALDYYSAEELNAQQRYVVYSTGEPDERGRSRPRTILATFDYLGNGVVFDHTGKIRLKYNQTEGVVLDRSIGPVSHWKWHTLNDPPVLQQVMIDTQMPYKDPRIMNIPESGGDSDKNEQSGNDDMLAIEFNNFVKEKSKKISQTFKPFQVRIKALKINENFSLRIVDQATVYLLFRDGKTNLKMNIGMILDHKEILDTIACDVGEVSISLDKYPARTASIAALQSAVEAAQRAERSRVRTERRLRRADPAAVASADRFAASVSVARPQLPSQLTTDSSDAISNTRACTWTLRKPYLANMYYDNRILT